MAEACFFSKVSVQVLKFEFLNSVSNLSPCLLAVLGSQGNVVKCTAAIVFGIQSINCLIFYKIITD